MGEDEFVDDVPFPEIVPPSRLNVAPDLTYTPPPTRLVLVCEVLKLIEVPFPPVIFPSVLLSLTVSVAPEFTVITDEVPLPVRVYPFRSRMTSMVEAAVVEESLLPLPITRSALVAPVRVNVPLSVRVMVVVVDSDDVSEDEEVEIPDVPLSVPLLSFQV